ncbi:MAG: hypothetical protein J6Z34_04255 [Clostridia bacterium]|nr:hypothetical protein [Clostridia bacterium]
MKKAIYFILTSIICFAAFFGGCTAGNKMENEITNSENGGKKLNLYGRNYYNGEQGADEFINVMSGFEVRFSGTCLTAEMKSLPKRQNGAADAPKFTVWSVFVDGAKDPFERSISVDNKEWETVTVVSGLPDGEHTVKVLKTDDPLISSCYVRNYGTDGKFLDAPKRPSLKIECFGDSITSGGDNIPLAEGEPYLGMDPKHCNGGATYISYTAYELNAELNVFAQIGIPLTGASGVANVYSRISPQRGTEWQMKKFVPDIVVIGLGTNDRRIDPSMNAYVDACKSFVNTLSVEYGDTAKKIRYILVHGFMDDGTATIGDKIQAAVNDLDAEGFRICRLQFPEASIKGSNGKLHYADQAPYWNGHPLWNEHKAASELLTEQIRKPAY